MHQRLVPAIAVALILLAPLTGLPVGASPNADAPTSGAPAPAVSVTSPASNHTENATETVPGTGAILDATAAPDGGTYLVGATAPQAANLTLTRLDANGSVVWQRQYGGPNESRVGRAVAASEDGIYVLETVGPASGPTSRPSERPTARLLRLDTEGGETWTRSLGNATYPPRNGGLVTSPEGGVVLAQPVATREPVTRLQRITADGTLAWNRSYEGGRPRTLTATDDGGYLVAGEQSFDEGWLLGVAPNGSVTMNVTFGGFHERSIAGVTPTEDGGVLIAGDAEVRGFSSVDPWAARVDSDGAVRWSRTYPTETRVRSQSAARTDEGLLVVQRGHDEFGTSETRLLHVTATGAVGQSSVSGERLSSVPRVLDDGTVRLYGTTYNRTGTTPETFEVEVRGTVTEATLPAPERAPLDPHAGITTNTTAYRGENLRLSGPDDATFSIFRLPGEYTEFDEPRLVRRVSPENGSVTVETATLERGRYAVRSAPHFWVELANGSATGITGNASAVAFELDERHVRFDYPPGERPRRGPSAGPGLNDSVVETFDGEGVVEGHLQFEGESLTARVGLARLNGSSPDADTLRAALAVDPQSGGMEGITTVNGRPYGTVELTEGDRNLTLDAGALPAGLYQLSVTPLRTADASEAATTQLVVVHEERDVGVVPENETLTLPADGQVETNLTLTGADAGLRAVRVEANRTGPPSVSLNLDLTRALDYRSASGGGGMSRDRSSAHAESLEIVSSPNGSFTVATLRVQAERFGDELPRTGNNTITLGPAFAVDSQGVPYSVGDSVTLTYTVTEAQNGTATNETDRSEESGEGSGSSSGSATGSASASGSASGSVEARAAD